MDWFGKRSSAIVDGGAPLGHAVSVGEQAAGGGAHVGGYSIIEAADMNAARGMVEGHPHFMMPGNSIDILEVMPMPGM
jgi:hypothetical protein